MSWLTQTALNKRHLIKFCGEILALYVQCGPKKTTVYYWNSKRKVQQNDTNEDINVLQCWRSKAILYITLLGNEESFWNDTMLYI